MQRIDASMLATHQLPVLFKENWLQKKVQEIQSVLVTFAHNAGDVDHICSEDDILALCRDREFFSAAKLLIDGVSIYRSSSTYGEYQLSPLMWAVEQSQLELMIVLMAMGERVNVFDSEGLHCPLSLACACGFDEVFNLLLLHPDIDVNVQGWAELEEADIRAFLDENTHQSMLPAMRLCRPEYVPVMQFLRVDTETTYGEDGHTLMVVACLNNDYQTMNQLLALGANINPSFDNGESGPNLLSWVLYQYNSYPNEKNLLRVKWFGRLTKILDEESWDNGLLAHEIIASDGISQEFGVLALKNLIAENNEQIEQLKYELECESTQHFLANGQESNKLVDVSLLDDLVRVSKVRFLPHISDIRFSRQGSEFAEFAVYTYENRFPASFKVQLSELQKHSAFDTPLAYCTSFQTLYWFFMAPTIVFEVIASFAQIQCIELFERDMFYTQM
ncbi:hypothetical protein HR45_16940 [Shewanella mangrovi]|uniref:Uncharacterized protein n=1 Tax=Shewanella mangrovi TaxID=1515746 RepID=A0A094LMM7_9GAMM|nr:ankyrin repeat domain-containing protein [Shewanella mangrovi]KFZ36343.1 hypothetical protein HR45_16940 [Shewanella mangrovi]